jgi:NodT family efflux transporter outer membrane factor (OMF) lipoprotein
MLCGRDSSATGHVRSEACEQRQLAMHLNPRRRSVALARATASAVCACAVGPDFHAPPTAKGAGYSVAPLPAATAGTAEPGGGPQRLLDGADVDFTWWQAFKSPALDSLVEQAWRANPSVPAAQAALREARELVAAQRGYFSPSINAGYTFERQKLAGNLATTAAPGLQGNGQNLVPSAPAQPLIFNFQTAGLSVGYTPDVFGGNRRRVESLAAQAELQRDELEATYVNLAANVVAAAIQEASIRAQLAATARIIECNEKSLALVRDKYAHGYASGVDLAAQEAQLAQARALLPPLGKQFEQTRDLLRVLAGRLPNEELPETFELGSLELPRDLPVSLPSQIISQRPDVRAALEQLRAANAQVGVATAAMLPQFSISAAAGGTATQLSWLFRDGGPFWSLIAGVTQPVFAGGTLWHTRRAAHEALRQAAAQYQQAVLGAYQNVADTLHAILADADALVATRAAERAAATTLDLTQQQVRAGYNDTLAELAAEIAYQQQLLALDQAEAARFGDSAALYVALGGGWWHRAAALAAAGHVSRRLEDAAP